MVDIILQGTRKEDGGKKLFEICKFKAGVILREEGGVYLNISNMELSKKMYLFLGSTKELGGAEAKK